MITVAAASTTLMLFALAFHRTAAAWWTALCQIRYERKTRGTMAHRSMTPTAVMLLLGMTAPVLAAPPVVVEIHAPAWCQPCKRIAPAVAKLNAEGFAIQQVDFDGADEPIATPGQVAKQPGKVWAKAFGVTAVPAFVVIDPATFKHTTTQAVLTEQQLRAFLAANGAKPRQDKR